jgi:hypothetical protein
MTDTAMDELQEQTKKGFDLLARLKNRGLRKATITLFLDEEKGVELGWAYDIMDRTQTVFIRRERGGYIGDLEELEEQHAKELEELNAQVEALKSTDAKAADVKKALDAVKAASESHSERKAELEGKIAELTDELKRTALVVSMRAVPPVIQKNTRRQAKEKMGITEKGIPEDKTEEFNLCQAAYLMTVMFQSITDNETGAVNTETTYDDAVALMDFLPVGQFQRLDEAMGRVQFTDNISRSIEGQEDFS